MIEYLTNNITQRLIMSEIVCEEERELYQFGLKYQIISFLSFASVIIIGLILGVVWGAILFLVSYVPIRMYAGGYHARSQKSCYVFSLLICVVAMLLIKYQCPLELWIKIGIILVSGIIVFLMAPMDHENKPLDQVEKKTYKNLARIIWFGEIVIVSISHFCDFYVLETSILTSLALISFVLLLGLVYQKRR